MHIDVPQPLQTSLRSSSWGVRHSITILTEKQATRSSRTIGWPADRCRERTNENAFYFQHLSSLLWSAGWSLLPVYFVCARFILDFFYEVASVAAEMWQKQFWYLTKIF